MSKGTQFGVLASVKDGKNYLLLFTDWAQLRMYSNKNVTGWVLPASDAWAFGLQKGFDGVVINPGHNALPLRREQILRVRQNYNSQGFDWAYKGAK